MKEFPLRADQLKGPFTQEECLMLASLFGNDTTLPRDNETEMIRQFGLHPERAIEHVFAAHYCAWELTHLVVEVARREFILDTLHASKQEFRTRAIAALVAHDEYVHGSWHFGGADANNLPS